MSSTAAMPRRADDAVSSTICCSAARPLALPLRRRRLGTSPSSPLLLRASLLASRRRCPWRKQQQPSPSLSSPSSSSSLSSAPERAPSLLASSRAGGERKRRAESLVRQTEKEEQMECVGERERERACRRMRDNRKRDALSTERCEEERKKLVLTLSFTFHSRLRALLGAELCIFSLAFATIRLNTFLLSRSAAD